MQPANILNCSLLFKTFFIKMYQLDFNFVAPRFARYLHIFDTLRTPKCDAEKLLLVEQDKTLRSHFVRSAVSRTYQCMGDVLVSLLFKLLSYGPAWLSVIATKLIGWRWTVCTTTVQSIHSVRTNRPAVLGPPHEVCSPIVFVQTIVSSKSNIFLSVF